MEQLPFLNSAFAEPTNQNNKYDSDREQLCNKNTAWPREGTGTVWRPDLTEVED